MFFTPVRYLAHKISWEVGTMPFGYSRKIFKHPAVQYIPLERYDEKYLVTWIEVLIWPDLYL